MRHNQLNLLALGSIPLMATLGNSMLIPVLPEIGRELHVSSLRVSMLITVYAVAAIVLIPFAGYLSDKFGRKAVIVPSLIIAIAGAGVSAVGAWLMKDGAAYWTIIGGRLLQGIGAAGAFPIVIPLVGDLYENEEAASRSLGVMETYNTFGKVLSPILGAALGVLIWYLPLLVIPVLFFISMLLVLFIIRAPKRKKDSTTIKEFAIGIKNILAEKGRWLYAIFTVGCICMLIIFGTLFYLSETLESDYGLHGILKGLVLAIPLVALCLFSYLGGKAAGKNKKRMKWLSFAGLAIMAGSLAVIGLFRNIYAVTGLFALGGAGIGLTLPCLDALITKGIGKKERGTITSIYSSMRFLGVSLGPPAVSLLLAGGHSLLFSVLAGMGCAAALLMLMSVKPKQGHPESGDRRKRRSRFPHGSVNTVPRMRRKTPAE
jgi:ACDE family multidrug resistance protein